MNGLHPSDRARAVPVPSGYLPRLLLPSFLAGFRLGDWFRLLRANRFAIDAPFWPRAVVATAGCFLTSGLARGERILARGKVADDAWERPVFILGLPRSGTSHFFELLSQSPELCHPTRFDCFNPHTFLLLRRAGLFALLRCLPKRKRLMDDLRDGWDSPEEDIVALAILSGAGERYHLVFPRHLPAAAYDDRRGAAGVAEDAALMAGLRGFTRKLVLLHGRSVLLKSPGHTRRIKAILDVFPRARFVMIFRNPVQQLASLLGMHESGAEFWSALQWPVAPGAGVAVGRQGAALREYFASRHLIPAESLVEIKYEDLVADRAGTVGDVCHKLSLSPPPSSALTVADVAGRRPPRDVPADFFPLLRHYRPLYDAGIYEAPR